ncbi:hypothetical protein PP479_02055 [Pseudomonas aeruginosa]|uniref:hypothetical protein n=1 Tax=Pseudomonas aeruginosa TaxID=287 RepID=UPI002B256B8E|nr:hypothetical protein [Pseudomonas aeruginosa]WOX95345.1 hypothetical protein PP479_02055 [Pseudomonas aeruginosa]HCE0322399.1 hypothetical protein [Pseudomonas aeruginosa]HCE3951683.1 hypothetical protein [Pseudomonas aeruginosa]
MTHFTVNVSGHPVFMRDGSIMTRHEVVNELNHQSAPSATGPNGAPHMSEHAANCDTLVVLNMGNGIPRRIGGLEVVSWSRGHALQEKTEMEDLIRQIALGVIPEDQAVRRCYQLMEQQGWM